MSLPPSVLQQPLPECMGSRKRLEEPNLRRHRVSVTFSLSARQVELLDRLAQRTNVPKSVYVRKAVDAVLKRYRGLLDKTDSTAEDGDADR